MHLAERISGSALPSLKDIYFKRCKSRAAKILKDSTHPGNHLFCLLPSGKRFRSMMAKTECNKVRKKEGSGQCWLVKTRVLYCTQMRTLRVLGTSTLLVVSVFTLCIRSGCLPHTDHAPESPLRLSSNARSTVALFGLSTPITAIRHRCSSFCT